MLNHVRSNAVQKYFLFFSEIINNYSNSFEIRAIADKNTRHDIIFLT